MLDEVSVPAYYVLNRSIDESRIPAAIDALSITPVACAVAIDLNDVPLALKFTRDVLKVGTAEQARQIALDINAGAQRAVLIVIDTDATLSAIYADGTTQELLSC